MIEDYFLIVLESSLQLHSAVTFACAKQMECENLWHLNVAGSLEKQIYQLNG